MSPTGDEQPLSIDSWTGSCFSVNGAGSVIFEYCYEYDVKYSILDTL